MIISIKHKFLFIHIPKTGGTSVTNFFKTIRWGVENLFVDQELHGHASAQSLTDTIGPEIFKSLYSFAFVRNPWDMEYSMYNYVLKNINHHRHHEIKKLKSFDNYIKFSYYKHLEKSINHSEKGLGTQMSFVCDEKSNLLVNKVARFENFSAEFNSILKKIGIATTEQLKHINKSTDGDYKQKYTSNLIDYVSAIHSNDIMYFDYKFE
jgi:hypothetical protein